jgi:MFS transporter, PPP family, 3-phenylpropionic acid transporter
MAGRLPYWRLSAYYLFYFAALGALVPYWGLFLQSRGFDALAIGQLMATLTATKIVAPLLWGHLSDRSGRRMPLVRLATLLAILVFATVFVADGFWAMAAAMTLFSFFWNASLPQMEAVTFNHLGLRVVRYARSGSGAPSGSSWWWRVSASSWSGPPWRWYLSGWPACSPPSGSAPW